MLKDIYRVLIGTLSTKDLREKEYTIAQQAMRIDFLEKTCTVVAYVPDSPEVIEERRVQQESDDIGFRVLEAMLSNPDKYVNA